MTPLPTCKKAEGTNCPVCTRHSLCSSFMMWYLSSTLCHWQVWLVPPQVLWGWKALVLTQYVRERMDGFCFALCWVVAQPPPLLPSQREGGVKGYGSFYSTPVPLLWHGALNPSFLSSLRATYRGNHGHRKQWRVSSMKCREFSTKQWAQT
ncbi:unnamed protein product [Discosporangium mesarthrocarpum]